MVLYAIRTEDRPEVRQWFEDARKKGAAVDFIKNPINWKMTLLKKRSGLLIVFDARPIVPKFFLFGWLSAIGIILVWGLNWAAWISIGIGMLGYCHTVEFFYNMTYLALRKKAKYAGSIKRVKLADVVREVVL